MKTQEVAASSTNLKVKMKDDSVQLEGVVVTALGIKRQKRELCYATATVSGKELTEVNNTNVFGSLSGKLAGVDISAPAQAGASTKVVIRGFNSYLQTKRCFMLLMELLLTIAQMELVVEQLLTGRMMLEME